mmetsp:Transcript_6167/g.14967  ORF Transcript_6167/g.14967 Transcript_6167/m.14967 type:complete len:203 (+) Transcript_6167:194-802(+)
MVVAGMLARVAAANTDQYDGYDRADCSVAVVAVVVAVADTAGFENAADEDCGTIVVAGDIETRKVVADAHPDDVLRDFPFGEGSLHCFLLGEVELGCVHGGIAVVHIGTAGCGQTNVGLEAAVRYPGVDAAGVDSSNVVVEVHYWEGGSSEVIIAGDDDRDGEQRIRNAGRFQLDLPLEGVGLSLAFRVLPKQEMDHFLDLL